MHLDLIIIIPTMAILSRMAGGGFYAHLFNKRGAVDDNGHDLGGIMPVNLTWVPELAFACFFGGAAYQTTATLCPASNLYIDILSATIGTAWSYLWMQTGHGTAYTMGNNPNIAQSGRKQTLSYVIDPLCRLFKQPLGGTFYSWVFMGLKGLLIGLPAFPFGLALAILWPQAYKIGWMTQKGDRATAIGEIASGLFAGLLIAITLFTTRKGRK